MSRTYQEEAAFIEKVNGHSYRYAHVRQVVRVEGDGADYTVPCQSLTTCTRFPPAQHKDGLCAEHARAVHLLR